MNDVVGLTWVDDGVKLRFLGNATVNVSLEPGEEPQPMLLSTLRERITARLRGLDAVRTVLAADLKLLGDSHPELRVFLESLDRTMHDRVFNEQARIYGVATRLAKAARLETVTAEPENKRSRGLMARALRMILEKR